MDRINEAAGGGRTDAGADLALLRRIRTGDREAFQLLFSGYYGRLLRFLGRLTTDEQLAEEIINDTLMVVWRKAGDFDARSQVSTWIFGIAYRLAMKAFGKRTALAGGAAGRVRPLADPVSATDQPQLEELGELLELALRRLSTEQRAVLELAYLMGYSCAEISEIVDCPVNTVKTRLFHARERVRLMWPALSGEGEIAVRETIE